MFLVDDATSVLLTAIFLLIMGALGVGIYFAIKKNLKHFKEEDDIIVENALTKSAMIQSINRHIKRVGNFGAATLMYIDIDSFHDLNELFGEKACDAILKEMANRIIRVLPYKGSLCRYDRDEFLVLIRDEDNEARIERVCQNILATINKPYQILIGDTINVSASIGVCTFPLAGQNLTELLGNLELTAYVSKRDGGNRYTSYYATIADEETHNMKYYKEIKEAILNKEFILYFQPIIDLKNRTIHGAEALMRWNHPTQGILSPQKFIRVMEQSGDIRWVGEWGIEAMIRFREEMHEKYPEIPLLLSLNLSIKQLLNPNFANTLIQSATRNKAKPSEFMLEISDVMMYEKIGVVKTNIFKLKDFGFKIAVDNFKLDGQSVQSIQRSPVDVIKLGRDFLKDIENNFMKEKLLQILMQFAKDNNRVIMAEGIEGAEYIEYVKAQGIDKASGFYFAKPLHPNDFINYLDNKAWSAQLDLVATREDEQNYGIDKKEEDVLVSDAVIEQEAVVEEEDIVLEEENKE